MIKIAFFILLQRKLHSHWQRALSHAVADAGQTGSLSSIPPPPTREPAASPTALQLPWDPALPGRRNSFDIWQVGEVPSGGCASAVSTVSTAVEAPDASRAAVAEISAPGP